MGKRKVTILEPTVEAVTKITFFIEGKGLPETAKRFVDKAFDFLNHYLTNGLFTAHASRYTGKDLICVAQLAAKNTWLLT